MAIASLLASPARAEEGAVRALVTDRIDDANRVTLSGNTRPEATVAHDRGVLPDAAPMRHMLLQLKRAPEQEQAVERLIEAQQDPRSPEYQRWISADAFGARFGLAASDLRAIEAWLTGHGFAVNRVYNNGMLVDFSGTAGQVRDAFHTEIHALSVNGVRHIANMADPQIPAALAAAVEGIVSLHDFRPHPTVVPRTNYSFTSGGNKYYALAPGDLATIYNVNPLFKKAIDGKGQTIVVIEDSDVYKTADWTAFRKQFGLAAAYKSGSFVQSHPGPGCTDPGANGNDFEAILDAEWASAAAPNAAIILAACDDTETTFGGLIAFDNLIAAKNPPKIFSISYGECEALNGKAANASFSKAYQQAVTEGISVFVAAGDWGAATCDADLTDNVTAFEGIAASGFASTVYNVAVGGTDFEDSYLKDNAKYWSAKNSATGSSAKSYIPEIPWNKSCASQLLADFISKKKVATFGADGFCNSKQATLGALQSIIAGGGAPSACATGKPGEDGVSGGTCKGTAKPSWQAILGNPKDGVRDLPDVALFAANGIWGHYYLVCYTDPQGGGTPCTGALSTWAGGGGTSFASPIMAGFQALVNQKTGKAQGNPAKVYYQLANAEYGTGGSTACDSDGTKAPAASCIFYDVTQGDMDVDCQSGIDCYWKTGVYGVLSTNNNADDPAFKTTKGWDFATGIGTVNVTNLVNNWPTAAASVQVSSLK